MPQLDRVRSAVIFCYSRMINGNVGGPLLEIRYGIASALHE